MNNINQSQCFLICECYFILPVSSTPFLRSSGCLHLLWNLKVPFFVVYNLKYVILAKKILGYFILIQTTENAVSSWFQKLFGENEIVIQHLYNFIIHDSKCTVHCSNCNLPFFDHILLLSSQCESSHSVTILDFLISIQHREKY